MDNRLVLTVLFVTLSWISVGTDAQTTTNMTSAANMASPNATMATQMTTAAGNNTTMAPHMTTAAGNNTTMAPHMTTAAGNNTTMAPHITTAAGNNMTMAPRMTTAAGNNMTMAPRMTTAAGNNTTMAPHMTTAAGNNTTMAPRMTTAAGNNTTMAPHMTTGAGNNATMAPTAAPPLTPNTTVETLETPVSNTECGSQQLCAAEPSMCDPSKEGSCFFLAAKQQSGQNFEFGLSGESEGYLAASLSTDSTLGGNDTTYVCANDNGVVKFFGALLNNDQLIQKELNVNSVKGKITGNKIQCTFAATVPSSLTRASSFALAISTGSFNSTSGTLGAPNTVLRSPVVDLGNPNITVTNEISPNTTTSPTTVMTTSHAITLQQSLTQALLITVGVLGMAML